MEYTCIKCNRTLPEEFFKLGSKIKSRNGRDAQCKECQYGYIPIVLRTEKKCLECGEIKPMSEFRFIDKKRGYTDSYCKPCKNRRNQARRDAKGNEYERYKNGRGKYRNIRETSRKQRFASKGITEEIYLNMLKDQNDKCLICKVSFDEIHSRDIHIDHCHTTNVVRGVLCARCNTGIGSLKDDTSVLESAIKYLEKFKEYDACI
jgi:hypothetical protein